MNLSKIHHIAIICSNYQVSKHFYTEILGLKIIQETYRESRDSYKLDLQIGENDQIELFSFPNPPARPTSPESCGLRHLAFQVDNVEVTVNQLRLRDVEVEPIRIDEITGKKFTFFRDPDDLPLEIYEK
ncbi:Glyoxalase/bleomycin resistance protein/dioxygenase [Stanieria cyanosphaera PCC 7437]|uniref:Glyoxalase/bleomycin resistance protein/dioxygenase n=1 Tax=Stanieria cyanosphaera (strain ATCC 29371 / PCC 7437) TaxID=111780 RepID=K9XPY6_STAC7|nr:VOC family protein [Stanieria cyanosphaera]AFZ34685.1 Glyoxalase/bleomycin resistance protein/dioxygenase [Stanieria cyanosphaera PCC 7437]